MHSAIQLCIRNGLLYQLEGLYLDHIMQSTSKDFASALPIAGYRDIAPFFQAIVEEITREQFPVNDSLVNPLMADMTFNTLIKTRGNQSAADLAFRICGNHSLLDNLFIYGGRGQGKTHLLSAIEHEIRKLNHGRSVVLVNMLDLAMVLERAHRRGIKDKFIEFLSNFNCLLIDDFQLCEARNQIQSDIFAVMDRHFQQPHNWLILSSDVPPGEFQFTEDRLKIALENVVTVELQPADESERIQILRILTKDTDISSDILEYIAKNAPQDIRELKSISTQLMIASRSLKRKIEPKLVKDILSLARKEISHSPGEPESGDDESPRKKKESKLRGGRNHYSRLLKEMIYSSESDKEHILAHEITLSQMIRRLAQTQSVESRPTIAELKLALQSVHDGDLSLAFEVMQGKM